MSDNGGVDNVVGADSLCPFFLCPASFSHICWQEYREDVGDVSFLAVGILKSHGFFVNSGTLEVGFEDMPWVLYCIVTTGGQQVRNADRMVQVMAGIHINAALVLENSAVGIVVVIKVAVAVSVAVDVVAVVLPVPQLPE